MIEHPLRITYKDSDYSFKLVKKGPVNKDTREFEVKIDSTVTTICKTDNGWIPKDASANINRELLNAIGLSLSLRFRLL